MANNMMESDPLEFTDNDIAEAIRRLESKGKQLPLGLERNLQKLSLLRSYPTVGHQNYRFVHLTFQEFFTARYLARQVARDRASFEAILRQHKYNRRYEIVWMFFAGLLTKVDESEFFFNLLDEEPRDLVGIQHIQLFMYCLSECPIRIRPSHWDKYQRRLADWLRLETRIARRRGIGSSMAFPENILREQLHSIPPCSTKTIMRTISDRNSLSKSFIEYIDQLKAECSDKSLFCWIMPSQYALKFSDKFNFTTMRILAQRSKLPETTASLFMEQIRSQSNPESYAYKTLMWQRHLPDKAIEDLVEWLEDPRLSGYVDQLLGNQTALSKETIDCAIEKLTGPLGYWDIHRYRSSVCLRQDLHAEAVGNVLDFLENAALRSKVILDPMLLDLSRMHLLQSDVERLGNLIKRRLCSIYKESKDLAVKALEQQANLSTNVLKIFVKLLRDEHSERFRAAQQILQKQPALHDDIIDKLRDLFKNDKGKVSAVLKERLQLPPKAMKWLVAQTTEAKDVDIRCRVAVDYLLGQSDLPDYLVNSFPELIEDRVDFKLVAKLLGQQREPSDEVVNRLLGLIPFRTEITTLRVPEIIKKDTFTDPLIEALEQAGSEEKAKNVGHLLRNTNLDQASVKRLRSLMNTERLGNNERDNRLAMMRSEIAYECMLRQVKLDRETILDLHAKIHSLKSSGKIHNPEIGRLWNHRHIEQFCINLAVIDSKIFPHILPIFLRVFLHRLVEDLTPAYIDGKTLYFYAVMEI